MLAQQIRLKTPIRSWLNNMLKGKKNQNKLLWPVLYFSLITLRGRRWEKNVGYEILHAGEEKQENKDLIKQYYCCSSPFSSGNLQFTPVNLLLSPPTECCHQLHFPPQSFHVLPSSTVTCSNRPKVMKQPSC